jgi:hypothetical protein
LFQFYEIVLHFLFLTLIFLLFWTQMSANKNIVVNHCVGCVFIPKICIGLFFALEKSFKYLFWIMKSLELGLSLLRFDSNNALSFFCCINFIFPWCFQHFYEIFIWLLNKCDVNHLLLQSLDSHLQFSLLIQKRLAEHFLHEVFILIYILNLFRLFSVV